MSNHEQDPGRVDWLDLGPDPDEGRTPPDPRRRYLWYGAAAALVVLALVLTRTQHGTNRAATSPRSPSATGTVSSSASTRTVSSTPASSGPASSGSFVDPSSLTASSDVQPTDPTGVPRLGPPKVTKLGHRLLDVPADWELFARGRGVVVRIQLALGRITTTPVPISRSDVPVVLFVGSDRVLLRSLDGIAGSVVRDGQRAADLSPLLRQGVWMLPGPDQQHLWSDEAGGEQGQMALLTLDGNSTGATIDVPVQAGVLGSDGAGYVLLSGIGGVYDARPNSVHRITTGMLLASGPTRWLAIECDDSLSCASVVIDRASGARHTLKTPLDSTVQNSGAISPDGRTAALLGEGGGISPSGLQLLDLDSGASQSVAVTQSSSEVVNSPQVIWSPDSRWLFATDAAGLIVIIDRDTGRATPLAARLPSVDQLALRHSSG